MKKKKDMKKSLDIEEDKEIKEKIDKTKHAVFYERKR